MELNNTDHRNHKVNTYDLSGEYGIGWTSNTNREFYFDLEDYDKIKDFCWCEAKHNKTGYTALTATNIYTKKTIKFHHIIGCAGYDHINRNPLDNRKCNLRMATEQNNTRNRGISKNNKSGVTGVYWCKSLQKWAMKITIDKNVIIREYYENKEDAIRARLKAEVKYYGEFAPQQHLFEQYSIERTS